ncbi:MAG TPA: NifU family protein [Solirubrobacteraceae bacterium]|jgi:Fe-S cluster biogenesis protein NfuA/nitrite reductase/ring-hydroxylating ferredoxin subunit|nr:NifU family protein [Solirubrobacteraceae bacterium]
MGGTATEQVARVESLLGELEALPDASARNTATEAIQALLDLYGEGLGRIVDVLAARDDGTLAQALADDELVAHLLLLHGLHPVPVEERVRGALEGVLPYLESHGGNVQLLGVENGIVHLRLEGSCSGCPSSSMTLKLAIEDAILKAAPDVDEVRAQGAVPPVPSASGLLQLEVVKPAGAPSVSPGAWAMVGGMPQLSGGGVLLKEVSGKPVLFLRPSERVYAYRPACPGCASTLERASLRANELTCADCGNRYDVLRAGRCLDAPRLHLEPVPLLVDDAGLVKVALGVAA